MVHTVGECSIWTESALSRTSPRICTGTTRVAVLAVWAEVPSCAGLASCGIVLAGAARRVVLPLEACKWFVGEQTPATAGQCRGSVDTRKDNGYRSKKSACNAGRKHIVVDMNRLVRRGRRGVESGRGRMGLTVLIVVTSRVSRVYVEENKLESCLVS